MNEEIANFWDVARERTALADLEVPLGPNEVALIQPPTWSFGETADQADEFVRDLIADGHAQLTAAVSDYDDQALPQLGDLSIVCDSGDHPRALVAVSAVDTDSGNLTQTVKVLYADGAPQHS